jgi:hypothetical protein
MTIESGEIYRVNLEPTIDGEEQGNAHPCFMRSITAFTNAWTIGVVPTSSPAFDRTDPFGWKSIVGCLVRAAPRDWQEAACRSTNGQTLAARS